MKKDTPSLPEDAKSLLAVLRASESSDLHDYVAALREADWPLRAVAEVLGVSRTAVAKWASSGEAENSPHDTPEVPLTAPQSRTRASRTYTPTQDETALLKDLTGRASRVRNYTDRNSSARVAASELETMLSDLHLKGATLRTLATCCGVSRASISQRLRKIEN